MREALQQLDPAWERLEPPEQERVLHLLIERVDVATDGIEIRVHAAGLRSLVDELGADDDEAVA